jgi:CRP-like cAMP-binding protein
VIFIQMPDDDAGASRELKERMDTMRNAPLFKYLSYRELVTLVNLAYTRAVSNGEKIIEEGTSGDELFLLVSGGARVLKGEQEIARLNQGSHFGEMALIDNAPRSATIKSIGPTRLLVIGRKPFYDYIRKDTAAGLKLLWSFLQILTLRLRTTDERLKEAQEELSIQQVEPEWILPED